MEYLWLFTTAGGALILGAVLAYVITHNRRLSASDKAKRDAKTRRLYHEGK